MAKMKPWMRKAYGLEKSIKEIDEIDLNSKESIEIQLGSAAKRAWKCGNPASGRQISYLAALMEPECRKWGWKTFDILHNSNAVLTKAGASALIDQFKAP